jgi:hypothetical protein
LPWRRDHFSLLLGNEGLDTLSCDYNNMAMFLRDSAQRQVPADAIIPRLPGDADFIKGCRIGFTPLHRLAAPAWSRQTHGPGL